MPYASKRMQLAAAGCRLGATCGIIHVSYHLKWDSTAITAQRCFFLADTRDNVGVCYTKPPLHWELRHAAHDSGRPQKRRGGMRVVLARLPMRRVSPGRDLSMLCTRTSTEQWQPIVAMQRLQGPV